MFKLLTAMLLLAYACVASYAQGGPTTEIHYLSGTGKDEAVLWDFFCTEGRRSGSWTKIPVPSNWENHGFGNYQYGGDRQRESNPFPKEQGKYRTSFAVPITWKSKVVRLVFEGSMTDTEVWINGKSAGPIHQGSFYEFKYDITPLLEVGKSNLLEVTVSKESTNTSVNRAERLGDYWNFGGIFRPVYLEILPLSYIDWTAIDAKANGEFTAQVNLSGSSSVAKASAVIVDSNGTAVGQPVQNEVSNDQVTLKAKLAKPKLWTAETPNLYSVRFTLLDTSGRSLHTVSERFGFRTFEVRQGDGFYLNGQRILLKGVNRHSFWPDSGRTLSKKISYDDVKLMKEMNMNTVRMSHYPPDAHFLAACDELGLYVLDELAGWQKFYDKPTGARLIGQMIRRDVNHPSIVLWDNGNEGGWNRENDDEFARWDIQKREVLHPWEKFRLTNTDHYEKFDSHTRLANGPDIYMPTEFLHGLYDGGIGAGMWDYWELIRASKVGGGAFFWALVDECVKRTDQQGKLDCAGNRGPDGIVGPYREKEGSFNTVREIWSPIVVSAAQSKVDQDTIFSIQNRFDFVNLSDCSFEWALTKYVPGGINGLSKRILQRGVMRGPNVRPHASGVLKLNRGRSWKEADLLFLTAKDPQGKEVWTWSWPVSDLKASEWVRRVAQSRNLSTVDGNQEAIIRVGALEAWFNKRTGKLVKLSTNGRDVTTLEGPKFLAFRRNDRKYEDVNGPSTLLQFDMREENRELIVETTYSGSLKRVRWRFSPDESIKLEYEYDYSGAVDMIGVQFDLPEKTVQRIRWFGGGPYRVWQNRMEGVRFDIWETAYNDSTPGESWIYPEFKGYFRDFRWTQLSTTAGPVMFATDEQDLFLGLYQPKDGVGGLLDLPNIGVAFLDVIPAMRNKFHTTEEIGPQSQTKSVTGVMKRSVSLRFGN